MDMPVCFVVMPFGRTESACHHYDQVYTSIIRHTMEGAGFQCVRGDEIPESGVIPRQIKEKLQTAELVVADLSGHNPNVFYELGYRHALGHFTITVADSLEGLPFDVQDYRTVLYNLTDVPLTDKNRATLTRMAIDIRERLTSLDGRKADKAPSEPPMADLRADLTVGINNIYQLLTEFAPNAGRWSHLYELLNGLRSSLDDQKRDFGTIREAVTDAIYASKVISQISSLGLVSIHLNRPEAIDDLYATMHEESEGISIVGSTLFGLRGAKTDNEKILRLLREKCRQPGFTLRILLTHWDHISQRQDQEGSEKNFARYVISKELMEAVQYLRRLELDQCVRFYKGAPTCFTIVCEGQGVMLANPYPYQREAFTSWSITFRNTPGGVYAPFWAAHVDKPWRNAKLSVGMDDETEVAVRTRLEEDAHRASEEIRLELGIGDRAER